MENGTSGMGANQRLMLGTLQHHIAEGLTLPTTITTGNPIARASPTYWRTMLVTLAERGLIEAEMDRELNITIYWVANPATPSPDYG
jgi:hypothetical protein